MKDIWNIVQEVVKINKILIVIAVVKAEADLVVKVWAVAMIVEITARKKIAKKTIKRKNIKRVEVVQDLHILLPRVEVEAIVVAEAIQDHILHTALIKRKKIGDENQILFYFF